MNVFGRRREGGPGPDAAAGRPADPSLGRGAEPLSTAVPTARDPDLGAPPFRPTRDASTMSLAPKPQMPTPTMPVGPTPPAGTAIPPRPPQMGGMGGGMGPGGQPGPSMPVPRPSGPDRRTLVVGRGISLQGTVADAERLVVEGTVESQMIQATELSISQTGVFKGEVQVEDAEIAGTFDGTLTARGQLVIRGTGRVVGVARCRRLMVEDGGQISGRMEMLGDTQVSPGPAPRGYAEG
jgi:cytoskeletal protein CcmA (bactofilin family)